MACANCHGPVGIRSLERIREGLGPELAAAVTWHTRRVACPRCGFWTDVPI